MKTTLMKTQFTGTMASSVRDFGAVEHFSFAPRPSNREWLPVPKVKVTRPDLAERARLSGLRGPRLIGAENRLLGLLMLVAASSVAYGFWMLLQFVENWGAFQAGIGRLVE